MTDICRYNLKLLLICLFIQHIVGSGSRFSFSLGMLKVTKFLLKNGSYFVEKNMFTTLKECFCTADTPVRIRIVRRKSFGSLLHRNNSHRTEDIIKIFIVNNTSHHISKEIGIGSESRTEMRLPN